MGVISAQPTYDNSVFLPSINQFDDNVMPSVHPDFKEYINPVQLRRLSRMLRIGLTAATICVRDSEISKPDGVITGSGFGFLGETAKFLGEILQQNEMQLTPTYFMQSTYNALSGLIALTLKCQGHNNAFVGRGHAFETAVHDAYFNLQTESSNFLVGAFDEADPVDFKVLSRVGHYKKDKVNNLNLFESNTAGTLQGESAAFFMLGKLPGEKSRAKIEDVQIVYSPSNTDELIDYTKKFLNENNISIYDLDLVIHGQSGDPKKDRLTLETAEALFDKNAQARFKHLSGEYCTSTSFAWWLSVMILKKQFVSELVRSNAISPDNLKLILILNHYQGKNYSLSLMRSI
jgi:3-oxoacyl-(acyl-carrier-protein) synthase